MTKNIFKTILLALCLISFVAHDAYAQKKDEVKEDLEPRLDDLKNEALSYVQPITGKIISVEGNSVRINVGAKETLKAGMRLNAFKEGVSFIHPVTKEPLGRIEIPVGNIEITSPDGNRAVGIITSGKPQDFLDSKLKIPATKIKLLFYQGNIDWYLGDFYYQMIKESGRFELIDTGIETDDISKILSEAKKKGVEAVLVLQSEEMKDNVNVVQRLFWAKDSKQFSEKKVSVNPSLVKKLRLRARFFSPAGGEVLLSYTIPFGAKRLAAGDFDGDGNLDIVFVQADEIKIYKPDVDLKLLWEFKVPMTDEILWIDVFDANKNGRDEIIITSMHNARVTSYIYELKDNSFKLLWKAEDIFVRNLDSRLIGQGYSKREGFEESVFYLVYADNTYKKAENLKLPKDVNIYDFQYIYSPDGRQAILAWDEDSRLNLYNEKGIKVWISNDDFGGFSSTFKKDSAMMIIEKGNWSIKDRLLSKNFELFAPKRKPLLGIARGLGYKGSEIISFWWNGNTIEERVFIEEFNEEILDYAILGDRMLVLAKPFLGLQAWKILKGENPLSSKLYIFSTKGR
jgi:hypothetical protein